MVIKTEEFKEVCKTILGAVDNSELSTLTETLELKTRGRDLFLNITNGEYYLSVRFPLDHEEEFRASVNANLFLKLIASVTTETIELVVKDTYVSVKANGTYKIPLIFDGDSIIELPEIVIENPTVEEKIGGDILQSIATYNSREVQKVSSSRPELQDFYIDESGCITSNGATACVNYFSLEKPVRVLVGQKVVKLFKLFKDNLTDFVLGYDPVNENLTLTKISFSTENIKLVVKTDCNNSKLNNFPAKGLRDRVDYEYPYSVVVNKDELVQAINRLLLFVNKDESTIRITTSSLNNTITITDYDSDNVERVSYTTNQVDEFEYSCLLDSLLLKNTLDAISEEYITICLGGHQSLLIEREGVVNLIAEKRDN